ncbi:hypothetical protein Tco_1183140 [Tanacetum coccineum]
MAVVEVPQTLEYKGGQLNDAPVLKVENFTNWKKRFMCRFIPMIIMANVSHDDEVPVVELNQHKDVPVVPESVLEDEDEDPEEEEFEEEKEDPQKEEDDMEVDIEEDENEPELTCPYEETDCLNPPSLAS